ncbi:hypothetical protein NH288_07920 [Anaerococcus sp. NML200537]|uniref:hypothetical protein n=1 Tax=Anaerococcus sp. NML200537 TaxID=2954485 RepID=UPI0022381CAB|nr:hypothetical protein [Anaerococcus sp. NML200537]MCW6702013.1 hypothetical protein [Anaerococcus sp. NML200537]
MKKIQNPTRAGLAFFILALVLNQNPNIPDLAKGLAYGLAIGTLLMGLKKKSAAC